MLRLFKTWPYAQTWRNWVRIFLETVLLLFFLTGLLQCVSLQEMRKNDPESIESAIKTFDACGWVGVGTIFVFNFSCIFLVLLNCCQRLCVSNHQNIR